MTVDAVRAELAATLQDAQRSADEWRQRAEAAEAERDLLAGIIQGIGGTVTPLDDGGVGGDWIWTHDWTFAGHVDGAPLTLAEADAVRRIIAEGDR